MIIIIQAAANGVFIKQDTSDDCHVFERINRAPRAAAKKVKELLDAHFENAAEEEGAEDGDGAQD